MKTIDLWDSNFGKFYTFSNDIEFFLTALKQGKRFSIKDTYVPGDSIDGLVDNKASDSNLIINYTDDDHSIGLPNSTILGPCVISSKFFATHKDKITEVLREYYRTEGLYSIFIYNFMFSEDLFEEIISNKRDVNYTFEGNCLSDDQIHALNDNFIDAEVLDEMGIRRQVSSKYVIGRYTSDDLKKKRELLIDANVSEHDLNNLKYVTENHKIVIIYSGMKNNAYCGVISDNEMDYYQGVKKIVDRLNQLGKTNEVEIDVNSRRHFEQISFENGNNMSVNLQIVNDGGHYTYSAYLNEERRLYSLIEHIRESDKSPLEKYLAVYDIAKKFKPYKENEDDRKQARYLRYILDNEYLVCVGFAKLLQTLLEKVDISSTDYSISIDSSYKDGFDISETPVNLTGHARLLVNIVDPKYGIDGYYISDPTWDNKIDKDYYNHALLPMDSMQENKEMMTLTPIDYIFDVHDFKEYCDKVNVYFRHLYDKRRPDISRESEKEVIENCYQKICTLIMFTLLELDKKAFDILKPSYDKTKSCDEKDFTSFITKVGYIVLTKTNKKVSNDTLADAIVASKSISDGDQLQRMKEELLESKHARDEEVFPYIPSETNVWEDKPKSI